MHQYDQYITDYLHANQEVTLENIGTIYKPLPSAENELPVHSANYLFTFGKKAVTTPALIDFIVSASGKSKTLIESDIRSHLELSKQFINIGKPYELPGIGRLSLGKNREYELTASDYNAKPEEGRSYRKQPQQNAVNTAGTSKNTRPAVMLFVFMIAIAILAIVGWGAYKLFFSEIMPPATDTVRPTSINTIIDTPLVTSRQDSNAGTLPISKPLVKDTGMYKFVFETTMQQARAYKRVQQLTALKHAAMMDSSKTDTGMLYKLYMVRKIHVKDTAAKRDSLRKLLGKTIAITQ